MRHVNCLYAAIALRRDVQMLEWRLYTFFDSQEQPRTTSVIREIQRRDFSLLATLLRHVIVQPLFVLALLLATVRAASQDFF